MTNRKALNRFVWLTAIATFLLLGAGGLVTSHGVGLSVPDWPNTYGYNLFLFPVSQWVGGVLYEHTHRLIAAFVGLLTALLAIWLWRRETHGAQRWIGIGLIAMAVLLLGVRLMAVYYALAALSVVAIAAGAIQAVRQPGTLRWFGVIALAAVILQGVLGGLRVVLLEDAIGIFHATLAQLFFVLMAVLALLTSSRWQPTPAAPDARPATADSHRSSRTGLRPLFVAVTLLILAQLILGSTMRHQHAGLAVPDFPLAYGRVWPATDADSVELYNQQRVEVLAQNPITAAQIHLHMAHRLLGVLILIGAGILAGTTWRRLRSSSPVSRTALMWFALIVLQVILGAATVLTNKAADVATFHVLLGALALALGTILSIVCCPGPVESRPAPGMPRPGAAPEACA